MRAIWRFLWRMRPFVGGAVTLGYPAYASVQAIQCAFQEDAQEWLAYWALYSFMTFLEHVLSFCWPVLGVIKFGACCWLLVPRLGRSGFIYENYIRSKLFSAAEECKEEVKQEFEEVMLEMMKRSSEEAVMRFMDEHGEDSFEKLMQVASSASKKKNAKTPRSSIRVYFKRN